MDDADTPDNGISGNNPAGSGYTHFDQRGEPRFRVHWHTGISFDGHSIFHGYTRDVSIEGATLYLDRHPEKAKSVSLRIQVPPLAEGAAPHAVDVEGNIVYTIHDSGELMFRTGIHFTRFDNESDRDFLASRLSSYPKTVDS